MFTVKILALEIGMLLVYAGIIMLLSVAFAL